MGNGRKAIQSLIFSVLLVVLALPALAGGVCRDDQVALRGDWGQARFTVELADDAPSRAKGLMNRDSLARSAGMLFVYPAPKRVGFWMKDTLIPLDMIFMDETGTVTRIGTRTCQLPPQLLPQRIALHGGAARACRWRQGKNCWRPNRM